MHWTHAGVRAILASLPSREAAMHDTLLPLTIDFLAWLKREPRTYADAMDAWRTSCPRLTVWEDAIDGGLIARKHTAGRDTLIELTTRGEALLAAQRRER